MSVAWTGNGRHLASGSADGTTRVWDADSGELLRTLEGHRARVRNVAWTGDGRRLASGSDDCTVRVWDADSGQLLRTLEGHGSGVRSVAWMGDGHRLASSSSDHTVRVWDAGSGETLEVYAFEYPAYELLDISFQPVLPLSSVTALGKTVLGDDNIIISSFDVDPGALAPTGTSLRLISAKIVLVGESNVGKFCLALRLAQDRYEEQGTTHGLRLWSMPPEQLSAEMVAPPGEKREVVLWDLGGQDEYRLIHQLFLHDTTLALILLDPTRGSRAFEDVKEWNLRLEKQLRGRMAIKLLVGTKLDEETTLIDQAGLDNLKDACGCLDYLPTSAKVPRGIDTLRAAIAQAINWSELSQTTRPLLFQRIRDIVDARQHNGEIVLLYADLEKQLRDADPQQFDPRAVNTVVEQLRMQGVIAESRLETGQRVLILQLGYIEQYAGSLIVAARNNPRGVPALEETAVASGRMLLPGLKAEERLHPFQEPIVLQCVIQLLLEHGICLKHEGLLIFPALFPSAVREEDTHVAHTVSLYYDFSGAIDNIYSSLVVRLALSERFGRVRLLKDSAEYEQPGPGRVRLAEGRSP
jgi:GTPase SAR1 family protein